MCVCDLFLGSNMNEIVCVMGGGRCLCVIAFVCACANVCAYVCVCVFKHIC